MGFISNQWLNAGQGLRNRSYSPREVTIRAEVAADAWSFSNNVPVEFIASLPNSQYQTLHLSASEVDSAASVIWSYCSPEMRKKLLIETLAEMGDQELLQVLAADLKLRVKEEK